MATSNKRIAKNTLFLYLRMILIMLVSLYISRVILEELGIDDYGVYTVIGGVVAMFSFINGSMTTSTQRFLNFELGKGTSNRLNEVFKTSMTIHGIIVIIVLILTETIGLWFINTKLVIPAKSFWQANVVYQASILSFCITIMQVPFNASIIAHERMNIYAYISIIEAVLKLGIAFSLMLIPTNKLASYGILVLFVHAVVAIIYILYCLRKYKECTLKFGYVKTLFREMSMFAGWNLWGSIAWLIRLQGLGIILNIFFGPALNAAKGIADQVASAVNSLNNNFQVALNPQITKNYAQGHLAEMELLTYRGIKFSTLLLLMMIIPISINIPYILSIWLTTVPPYTPIFIILILTDVLCGNLFGSPLMASLAATGNIRNYQLVVSLILLLILPVSYYLLKFKFLPESVFYVNIILNLLAGITRFQFCRHQLGYKFKDYLKTVLLPIATIAFISLGTLITLKYLFFSGSTFISFISLLLISLFIIIVTAWYFAFTSHERTLLLSFVKNKIIKNGTGL